jgi:hypothetical protein
VARSERHTWQCALRIARCARAREARRACVVTLTPVRWAVVGGAVSAALTRVADCQTDRLGGRPVMVSLGLHQDLHRPGGKQVAVPAPGEPVKVRAAMSS